jgi:hypothetical protein
MAVNYPQLLEESVLKLSNLIKQRRKLDRDIARLERFISSTARATQVTLPITNASAAPMFDTISIGFTEAIRARSRHIQNLAYSGLDTTFTSHSRIQYKAL